MSHHSNSIKILIVDDNPNNLLSLRALIEKNFKQAEVIEADSGISALSMLLKISADLIFLDIQMPQMDGFETAQMIKSRIKTRNIPIIFLTAAYKSDEFKKKGFDVGAADYLTKPIDPKKLTNKIRLYLNFLQKKDEPTIKHATGASKTEASTLENMRKSISIILSSNEKIGKLATNTGDKSFLPELKQINSELRYLMLAIDSLEKNQYQN
jgi:CheY-like chemotaxis protein